ncbi:MAG: hypothetical protein BRC40_13040, partial [Cyanobacteria bacterium QH_8_48_120]
QTTFISGIRPVFFRVKSRVTYHRDSTTSAAQMESNTGFEIIARNVSIKAAIGLSSYLNYFRATDNLLQTATLTAGKHRVGSTAKSESRLKVLGKD